MTGGRVHREIVTLMSVERFWMLRALAGTLTRGDREGHYRLFVMLRGFPPERALPRARRSTTATQHGDTVEVGRE